MNRLHKYHSIVWPILFIPLLLTASPASAKTIVIYGDTMSGVAAAAKSAFYAPQHQVILIAPYAVDSTRLGGLGTIGGQNFFDRHPQNGTDPQGGTFAWWLSQHGQFYNTNDMALQMFNDLKKYTNLRIIYSQDIENLTTATGPFRITSVSLRSISRGANGLISWGSTTQTVSADVFIDASDDGRLARLSNWAGTAGRYDWPAGRLGTDETGSSGRARQQAATLMFKVTGVDCSTLPERKTTCTPDSNQTLGYTGGVPEYTTDSTIIDFNNTYGPRGYALKPFNAAQDGTGLNYWWVNALLVFNVDGRAWTRDQGTWRYPTDVRPDYKPVDQAWIDARNILKSSDFLRALRKFPGFAQAQLVLDTSGNPVVGEVLYVRESVHMAINSTARANGTENTNYALTMDQTVNAGTSPSTGSDAVNYSTRIGLVLYNLDINAYQFSDLKTSNPDGGSPRFIWWKDVTNALRGDLGIPTEKEPNPVYVPYKALTTNYCANLLLPGYATGTPSFSWSEVRVLPNLIVLGDAAGVAAAYSVNKGLNPLYLSSTDIAQVQSMLRGVSARLEK